MSIVQKVENWLWSIALKKGVHAAVKVIIGFITSIKVAEILSQSGVSVDASTLEGALTAAITACLTMLQNWLKVKFNISWL